MDWRRSSGLYTAEHGGFSVRVEKDWYSSFWHGSAFSMSVKVKLLGGFSTVREAKRAIEKAVLALEACA